MDLFHEAEMNGLALHETVSALQHQLSEELSFQQFLETVEKANVSVNMRIAGLIGLLATGELRSLPDIACDISKVLGEDAGALLEKQLGIWHEKRTRFEAECTSEGTLLYGALNIGSNGATIYGDYCVLFDSAELVNGRLAYVREDSLSYVDDGGVVDTAKLRGDLATESTKHLLALLKHVVDLDAPAEAWPSIVCSSSKYIEAIFTSPQAPLSVQGIVVSQSHRELLRGLLVDRYRRDLTTIEKAVVDDFVTLSTLLARQNLRLTEVPSAY
jgi:hypothetical protein